MLKLFGQIKFLGKVDFRVATSGAGGISESYGVSLANLFHGSRINEATNSRRHVASAGTSLFQSHHVVFSRQPTLVTTQLCVSAHHLSSSRLLPNLELSPKRLGQSENFSGRRASAVAVRR